MLGSIVSPLDGLRSPFGPPRGFNPARLFGTTDTGWLYDHSDMSTLFQDAAGTTPVTAVNQPVGLCLDKSKGLVRGPELVTNGTFDTDTAWTKGTGWTISGGVASFTATGATSNLSQVGVVTIGRSYRISVSVTRSAGQVRVLVGNSAATPWYTAAGTYTALVAAAGSTEIIIQADAAFVGTIDNISVRELPGNHRRQSASLPRPTYARHPLGGIRNLLTFTEDLTNGVWTKFDATVSPNNVMSPTGDMTADTVTATSDWGVWQTFSNATVGQSYTFSAWVKVPSPRKVQMVLDGTIATFDATTDWQRFSITKVVGNTSFTAVLRRNIPGAEAGLDTYVWGAQLELGSTATAYQRVGSAFDVTEAGQPDLYYLAYDGSDDSLSTAPFAWGSDKATVVAGVRKLSDAASGIVAEISANSGTSAGAFQLSAPWDGTFRYGFRSNGTVSAPAVTTSTTFNAPITNVLTGLGDISGDRATLRIDGTQVAQATTDQGTGNYGTHAAFFGARAGTSGFFKGWEYSNVGISRLLTTGELAALESWTAGKAGNTL